MASASRRILMEAELNAATPRKAGVMALFYPDRNNTANIVLLMRKDYQGVHANQVGFPGGKMEEEDRDIEATAIRETVEETGVPAESIQVIRSLTSLYVPPSNFMVYPFMGILSAPPFFYPQPEEVAELVEVPLADMLDDSIVLKKDFITSYGSNKNVPYFRFRGYDVWGATAAMLSEVKDLVITAME
ncbi:NUDIX hydrolase [Sinomicrobium soli]|uniref:NUDIX hydrolase n=1 Tax=Sinomicrobium sp. N-1-3-6 TaxID=2219864 RepID=UPI001F3D44E1|nr:CoA pyrophosphatase [Sinomicrobium sp. N-1-3-6]